MRERAITLVNRALWGFERETGLPPRVALLPWKLYRRWEAERANLAGILPETPPVAGDMGEKDWVEVRVVEHEAAQTIEVY